MVLAGCLKLLSALVLGLGPAQAVTAPTLPVVEGQQVVASVNDELVTLDELLGELGRIHRAAAEDKAPATMPHVSEVLDRIINSRLIVQEGRAMGLDELPEFDASLRAFREETLRRRLLEHELGPVERGERTEVEELYAEVAREYRARVVVLDAEADARALAERAHGGQDFAEVAGEMAAAGKATIGPEPQFESLEDLPADAQNTVAAMSLGEVSAPLPLGEVWAVIQLLETRVGENPEAREAAETEAQKRKRRRQLSELLESLKTRYAEIDDELLASLDYDGAPENAAKLLADERVLVQIKGGDTVTVKDLTKSIRMRFFHGLERAMEKKRVNHRKDQALDMLLLDRLSVLDAQRQKLDASPAFELELAEREDAAVFALFLKRAVDPGIKLDDAALQAYLDAHQSEYSTPELLRIDDIVFESRESAEAALTRLSQGADLGWMRDNAEGQVSGTNEEILRFGGALYVRDSLPEAVRKALVGAQAGDYRFYAADAKGPYYVLLLKEVVPGATRPLAEVRKQVARQVFRERRSAGIEEWARKLREAGSVEIYATGEALEGLVRHETGGPAQPESR